MLRRALLLCRAERCASASAGDGNVLVHDLTRGDVAYGLGANRAAVRAMHASRSRLVCAGDDGGVIAYDFLDTAGESRREPSREPSRRQEGGPAAKPAATKPKSAAQARERDPQVALIGL